MNEVEAQRLSWISQPGEVNEGGSKIRAHQRQLISRRTRTKSRRNAMRIQQLNGRLGGAIWIGSGSRVSGKA